MLNTFTFKRAQKLLVDAGPVEAVNFPYVASFDANLRKLGFMLDGDLALALLGMQTKALTDLADAVIKAAKEVKGVRSYRAMYPNFPKQVMEASSAELWINAIVHYWSAGKLVPDYITEAREDLSFDESKLTRIGLIDSKGVNDLIASLLGSKSAWSVADVADIKSLDILTVLSAAKAVKFENRENKATWSAFVFDKNVTLPDADTATDVLRFAVALSDGDVSLAEKTNFRNFKRRERRFIMGLLNNVKSPVEDMARHDQAWKRLGEKLHAGEYVGLYPNAVKAFAALRNDKVVTFNAKVEKALSAGDTFSALTLLESRPGDFARRLNGLLTSAKKDSKALQSIVLCFSNVAAQASPTVLLQARNEFINYGKEFRTYFPKGSVNKMQVHENKRGSLPGWVLDSLAGIFDDALVKNFVGRDDLGGSWVDPALKKVAVPFALRNATEARTLAKGSRITFDRDADTLRFFIWWKNGDAGRVDVDLSACAYDDKFNSVFDVAYYNLREGGAVHSGDIVDAPNGASEFIDINLEALRKKGARYVAMNVISFSGQTFDAMGEAFAGFMERTKAQSGEIYDPRTVANKTDLVGKTRNSIPFIFDLETGEAIWVDLSMSVNHIGANAHNSKAQTRSVLEVMVKHTPPNLYDLFTLHGVARGGLTTKEKAKTIFSFDGDVTPFDTEVILDKFL